MTAEQQLKEEAVAGTLYQALFEPRGTQPCWSKPVSQLSFWKQASEKDKAYLRLLFGTDWKDRLPVTVEDQIEFQLIDYWKSVHTGARPAQGDIVKVVVVYTAAGITDSINVMFESGMFSLGLEDFVAEVAKLQAHTLAVRLDHACDWDKLEFYTVSILQVNLNK